MNRITLRDEDSVTIRPSATALLCIDSDDRYQTYAQGRSNATYPFQFSIQKNESLLNGFFKRMALTEFRMNWTLPNISKVWGNNTINFNYSTGSAFSNVTLTIPDGFYNADLLALELQQAIQNTSSNLSDFQCFIGPYADDYIVLQANPSSGVVFNVQPVTGTTRQLYDMLSFSPTSSNSSNKTVYSGVPSLRATDYVDIVCSQLTYNQKLKDATTAPISRDMIARIYLDESTPSRTTTNTNVYSSSNVSNVPTALIYSNANIAYFNLGSNVPNSNITNGAPCTVSGITGGSNWNTSYAYVINAQTSNATNPTNTIGVQYVTVSPSGTPVFSGSPVIAIESLSQVQTPLKLWDDHINGVTPFVIYRQFPYPKQIRWSENMPLGNLIFEIYDDQGRSVQNLWNSSYPNVSGFGFAFASTFAWNMTVLVSED